MRYGRIDIIFNNYVDIANLSGTSVADKGQMTGAGSGDISRICSSIKAHIAQRLSKLPEEISDLLMTLDLPLGSKRSATLGNAYGLMMINQMKYGK